MYRADPPPALLLRTFAKSTDAGHRPSAAAVGVCDVVSELGLEVGVDFGLPDSVGGADRVTVDVTAVDCDETVSDPERPLHADNTAIRPSIGAARCTRFPMSICLNLPVCRSTQNSSGCPHLRAPVRPIPQTSAALIRRSPRSDGVDQLVSGGVRVQIPGHDLLGERSQVLVTSGVRHPSPQCAHRDGRDLTLGASRATLSQFVVFD